jgi:hypothetical protein
VKEGKCQEGEPLVFVVGVTGKGCVNRYLKGRECTAKHARDKYSRRREK